LQSGEDSSDVVVDAFDHPVVRWHESLETFLGQVLLRRRPSGGLLFALIESRRNRRLTCSEHRIVRSTDGVRAMRIGDADHVAKRLVPVRVDKVNRLGCEPVGRERFFICAFDSVIRLVLVVARRHARACRSIFHLLVVAPVEHVAVILEAELALRRPLRLARTVYVPFACVSRRVTFAAQNLGKCHYGEQTGVVA